MDLKSLKLTYLFFVFLGNSMLTAEVALDLLFVLN